LLSVAISGAQVASHAPTTIVQPPARSAAAPPARVLVRVNGTELTEADLLRVEYAIFPYARQHNGLPKGMETQIRDGAMKMMVFEELAYQEALRRGMTISAVKMQRAEADFRRTFDSPDQYSEFLQSEFHGSDQLLRAKIRRSLLIEALLKTEVEDKSVISPAELRAFYDKNPAKFAHPESYTFQTISILPPEKATEAQVKEGRERADKALKEARATKSAVEFGLLAEKTSDDDFRVVMGQHKPVPVDQLSPPVLKALRAMKPGDVSDVIQMDKAFTIVRLNAHTPAGQTKFEDVRTNLKKQMYQTRREAARSALDQQLRQKAKIEELNQVAERGN
jgi:hypothetical protein